MDNDVIVHESLILFYIYQYNQNILQVMQCAH